LNAPLFDNIKKKLVVSGENHFRARSLLVVVIVMMIFWQTTSRATTTTTAATTSSCERKREMLGVSGRKTHAAPSKSYAKEKIIPKKLQNVL